MLIIHNDFWNTLSIFYYNEEGILMQDVEKGEGVFYSPHPAPLSLYTLRNLFKNSILHDDVEDMIEIIHEE